MTTIGSSSTVVTLSATAPVVTITGPVDAFGTVGTYLSGGTLTPFEAAIFGAGTTHFTILNTGLVKSVGTTREDIGILLAAAGTIDNTGTIIAGTGVNMFGSATPDLLVNSNFIEGTIGAAVVINGIATLDNAGTLLSTQSDGAYIHFGGTAINTGTIIGFREGVQSAYGAATIVNQGDIIATATSFVNNGTTDISHGILLKEGGAVTNSAAGTIIGETGIAILGTAGGHVVNDGHITATGHSGIYLFSKGVIENAKTGLIQSARASMELYGGGTANNYGTIDSARSGIYLKAGGKVHNTGAITAGTSGIYDFSGTAAAYNEKTGRITAADSGIDLKSGGHAYNAGFISGTLSGIYIGGSGSVTNAKSGTIDSATLGIVLEAGGIVNNAGLIDSAGTGISIKSGSATNTGTILSTGIAPGIYIGGTAAAVDNAKTGLIAAADGIELLAKAQATNAGTIKVTIGTGIILAAGGTLTNSGLIATSDPFIGGGDGIVLEGGGRIVNTGTIDAASSAIQVTAGGTIVDSGTLIGGSDAIYFGALGSTSNLLILSPTAHTVGTVSGGGGRLELEADGAKIGTAAPAQFVDFDSVTIESKAIWDMAGTFLTSLGLTLVNDGTIKESAADLITISGAIEGTGLIDLSKQAFTLEGSIAAGQTIAFTGTAETLGLANPQDFHAKIEHFSIGDTIELEGVPKTSIATTHFAGGVLTLTGDGHTVDITFASPASFGTDIFVLTAEGANTALTLKKPAMSILSPTTPPAATTLPTLSPPAASTPTTPAAALTTSVPTPLGIATALLHQSPTTLPPITLQP
jgi:hypothetical protein